MNEPVIQMARRVLVAVDASDASLAGLQAAADLAVRLQAELHGLFVEDINLLRLASLPFATEVVYAAPAARRLDPVGMERALRAQAERVRRRLEAAARQASVPWSFQVARGQVAAELLTRTHEADVLILGRGAAGSRLGSVARTVSVQATCTVLLHGGRGVERPVVAVYDGSPLAARVLDLAIRLSRQDGHNLTVLLVPGEGVPAAVLRERAEAQLEGAGPEARVATLAHGDVGELLRAVRAQDGKLLVLPASAPALADTAQGNLLDQLDCPVLLVR